MNNPNIVRAIVGTRVFAMVQPKTVLLVCLRAKKVGLLALPQEANPDLVHSCPLYCTIVKHPLPAMVRI